MSIKFKPDHPEFCCIEVEFNGNHAKQYEYFCEIPKNRKDAIVEGLAPRTGDICVVPTSGALAIGRIVMIKDFSAASDKCFAVCFEHWRPDTVAFCMSENKKNLEYQQQKALQDDLEDLL